LYKYDKYECSKPNAQRSKEKISAMVYKIVWILKALQTYIENMNYLETDWTEKEVKKFAFTVEKKISVLSKQPGIGSPRNKKQQDIRHTVLYKRMSLIYRVNKPGLSAISAESSMLMADSSQPNLSSQNSRKYLL
jgi:plasmid stabilization system protein ParE